MGREMTVALAQTGPVASDDPGDGVIEACRLIEQASDAGADLICFGELFLAPFFPNRLEEDFDRFFLHLPDPRINPIFEAAKACELAVIFPFAEKTQSSYYNAALVIDPAGRTVGTYRKTHIPAYFPTELQGGTGSFEKFYFKPGNELPVFDVCGVRIGIQICNDRLYPEPSRVLAQRGAEVLFMPICYSTYGDAEHRQSLWELPLRTRAFENGTYVAAVNRVGDEGPRHHIDRSMVVSPRGEILSEASNTQTELLVHTIDVDQVSAARKKFPWWRDRRPDLYNELIRSE